MVSRSIQGRSVMKFEHINALQTYGFTATVGDRTVEVLRSYPGDWFVYALIDGRVCKAGSDEKRPMSYTDAMRDARDFLNRKVTWELWP